MQTKRQALGQLIVCKGCCCGQTERGLPAVPVEYLKKIWKDEKLNRFVQLTISGCLGPCDAVNVALILRPVGMEWLGGLAGHDYDLLIAWARDCARERGLLPLDNVLNQRRMEQRFALKMAEVS